MVTLESEISDITGEVERIRVDFEIEGMIAEELPEDLIPVGIVFYSVEEEKMVTLEHNDYQQVKEGMAKIRGDSQNLIEKVLKFVRDSSTKPEVDNE